MSLANTIRVASRASNEQYSSFYDTRQTELARLDGKESQAHRETWAYLKGKGRG